MRKLRLVKTGREPCTAPQEGPQQPLPSLSRGAAPQGHSPGASRPETPADVIDMELQKIDALLTRMEAISAQLRTR